MQLNRKKGVRSALGAAAYGLLGIPLIAASASADSASLMKNWKLDAAALFYNEKDRITVFEPTIKARKDFGDERFLNLKLTFDSISGASPNGASPATFTQTFTSPSGNSVDTIKPGDTPFNSNFKDARYAVDASWDQPLGRLNKVSLGANASFERDYTSFGLNGSFSRDFNQRNTTLSLGASLQADNVKPNGGVPEELAAVDVAKVRPAVAEEDSKLVLDLVLGLTQVIDRETIMQVNYSYGLADGYLSDPYKIISLIDGTTGNTTGYINEKRPSTRNRSSVYLEMKHHFTADVITASYRYFWDDWGISSNTVDIQYRYELGNSMYLEPRLRLYQQSAADFYRHSIVNGSVPGVASADYRLGELTSGTIGLKIGWNPGYAYFKKLGFVVESYRITGNKHPADTIGVQRGLDFFPTVEAVILQISASF